MIITKYKHNDSHKTIESLSYNLSLLSLCDAEWQASIERNHLCLYSGLIVASWSTDLCLIISHEKFVVFNRLRQEREKLGRWEWTRVLPCRVAFYLREIRQHRCYHPLSNQIWQEHFVKPLSLSGNSDEYTSHLQFRSITLCCSQALFALMDELLQCVREADNSWPHFINWEPKAQQFDLHSCRAVNGAQVTHPAHLWFGEKFASGASVFLFGKLQLL